MKVSTIQKKEHARHVSELEGVRWGRLTEVPRGAELAVGDVFLVVADYVHFLRAEKTYARSSLPSSFVGLPLEKGDQFTVEVE